MTAGVLQARAGRHVACIGYLAKISSAHLIALFGRRTL
jgi:hypothetical protein